MNANAKLLPILPSLALNRILYATDFSPASVAALPWISAIARKYGSHLFVAHVWTPPPYTMITSETEGEVEELEQNRARDRAKELLAKQLAGVPATVVVRSGSPLQEITAIVREQNIDLVILTTHGRSGLKHLSMGSVAEELLRNLPCPVLTVGPHVATGMMEKAELKHILFPTDFSDASRAALPFLSSLAAEYKAPMTLLHVLPTETAINPAAMAREGSKELRDTLSPFLDRHCSPEYVVDFGNPVERTLAYARSRHSSLIGLGLKPANCLATRFCKTLPYRIILEAGCPVLTLSDPHRWQS